MYRPLRVAELASGQRWATVGAGAPSASRITTRPVGYGDGWVRAYGAGTDARVDGRRVPLVGTVAMDSVAADVTDVRGVTGANEVWLLGAQGRERITAAELARVRNTISWEVLVSMAYRLPRVYHAGPAITGLRTSAGETLTAEDGRA